jgi:hypothetical protein
MSRHSIAEGLLGVPIEAGGFAPCPGRGFHTTKNGRKDFRVILDGAPTGFCLHSNCADEIAKFNKELRRKIWWEEHGAARYGVEGATAVQKAKEWGVAAEPQATVEARPALDLTAIAEHTRGVPAVDVNFLRVRSPMNPDGMSSGAFLDHLYSTDERILIFTDQRTQGDFIWWRGRGGFRLSQTQGVKAVASALPVGAAEGVWFLVQPVTGQWAINANAVKMGGEAKFSRRSQGNVTGWRYFVLESDELPMEEWLRVAANLRMPIAAMYTSGKRSVHVLVRVECASKAQWDVMRNALRQFVCPLGADPAALTAVRLSRLPGCKRGEQMQKLLYLDPSPGYEPIWTRKVVRA